MQDHFVQAALMLAGFVVPLTITLLLGRALGITQHGQQVAAATHQTGATSSTAGSENTVPQQAPVDAGKPVPPAAATSDSQAADEAAPRESPPAPAESAPRGNSPAPPAPAPPAADDAQRFLALYDGAAQLAEDGDKELARAMLISIAAVPAPNAECLMCRGKAQAFLGDFPRALDDAATAIALSPQDARTWHTRAMIFAEAGKLSAAINDVNVAVTLATPGRYEPQYVKEVTGYAGVLSERAKSRSAASAAGGSKRQPDSPAWRHYRAGMAQFKQGAFAEAVREFTQAIRSKPNSAASYHWRAVALIEVRQFGSALADMNRSLSLSPASPVALHARAVVFEHLGRYRQAYADIIEALRLSPGNLEYVNYLARLRAKTKALPFSMPVQWRTPSWEDRVGSRYGVSSLDLNAGLADAGT